MARRPGGMAPPSVGADAGGAPADFDAVLQKATAIKSAQLKARPGRQQWEEAPDWFKAHTLTRPRAGQPGACQGGAQGGDAAPATQPQRQGGGGGRGGGDGDGDEGHTHATGCSPLASRLSASKSLRGCGNDAYAEGRLEEALAYYVRSAALFAWFEQRGDDVPLVRAPELLQLDEPEDEGLQQRSSDRKHALALPQQQAQQALVALCAALCNAAQVRLQMRDGPGALFAARLCLRFQPAHVKAMYRAAQAHLLLGSGFDLEEAVRLLDRGSTLEPNNFEVAKARRRARMALRAQNDRDRQTFGAIFDERDGEALYEDTRRERAGSGGDLSSTSSSSTGHARAAHAPVAAEPSEKDIRIAAQLGIDPRDPRMELVRKRLAMERKKRDRELAERLGLDLDDPAVQAEMARIEAEVEREKSRQAQHEAAISAGGARAVGARLAGAAESAAGVTGNALRRILPHTRELHGWRAALMWGLHGLILAHFGRTMWRVLWAPGRAHILSATGGADGAVADDPQVY